MALRIDDSAFYCYLPGHYLRALLLQEVVVKALLAELDVPGKPAQLNRLPLEQKIALIDAQATHLQNVRSSLWYGVPIPVILVACIWRSNLTNRDVFGHFAAVKNEVELARPVAQWLRSSKLTPYAEVAMGTKRADLVGYRQGRWLRAPSVVAVELKNDTAQLKRGLDQMTTFGEYATQVYMACTPAMAVEYLDSHAWQPSVKHWDSHLLNKKLQTCGLGLLLVMGPQVVELISAKERVPDPSKVDEVVNILRSRAEFV
ncbi:MAG: hypothetical protein SFV15_11705 [Polyangiaceae bacterium]|nr:hypothetical protein [Polyangiaceae bacterium]